MSLESYAQQPIQSLLIQQGTHTAAAITAVCASGAVVTGIALNVFLNGSRCVTLGNAVKSARKDLSKNDSAQRDMLKPILDTLQTAFDQPSVAKTKEYLNRAMMKLWMRLCSYELKWGLFEFAVSAALGAAITKIPSVAPLTGHHLGALQGSFRLHWIQRMLSFVPESVYRLPVVPYIHIGWSDAIKMQAGLNPAQCSAMAAMNQIPAAIRKSCTTGPRSSRVKTVVVSVVVAVAKVSIVFGVSTLFVAKNVKMPFYNQERGVAYIGALTGAGIANAIL
eukprot:PhM_4_TR7719/c1_g1_i1/m.89919